MNDIQESDRTQDRRSRLARMRVWRGINSSILVFSIFSPWLTNCDGIEYSGADLIAYSFDESAFAILGLSFLIYLFLNTLHMLWSNIEINLFLIRGSLLGSVLFLFLSSVLAYSFLWGYYTAWFGVLSSLILEIKEYRSKKENKSDSAEEMEPT